MEMMLIHMEEKDLKGLCLSPRKNKKHGSCKILETEDLETVKENRQTDPRTKEEEKCPQLDQKEAEL